MTPLDLSRRPPRPPDEELDGIAFLPRAIDKTRSSFEGGVPGAYFNERPGIVTLSGMFYEAMRVAHDDFARCVQRSPGEAEVAVWVRAAAGDERIATWNARLRAIRLRHMTPEQRTIFNGVYGDGALALAPEMRLIDAIAADDERQSWDDRDSNSDALSSGKF